MKADKGNTVVILYRSDYVIKMLDILSDTSKFRQVNEEHTLDRLRKFQSFLRYHHKKGVFSDSDYSEIFPTGTTIPTMYGLPKTHKHGVPLRPILSMVGSFNHSFAKWLGRKLEPLRSAKSIARDSFSLGFLRDSNLNSGFFVSYDVVSLFTNIPLNDTIDIILEHLYPRTSGLSARDRKFEGMTKTVFKRSLEWCLKDNVFIFNSKFYLQIDGCAMGSPLAPILADIFMNHILEDNITRNTEHNFKDISFKSLNDFPQFNLKLFIRYVDDTLAVFDSRQDALDFLNYLNTTPSIKPENTKPTVINISNTKLDPNETELLSLGLKFCPTDLRPNTAAIASSIEPTTKSFDRAVEHAIANDIATILQQPSRPTNNLKPHLSKALKTLRQKKNKLKITRADKGNATVVVMTQDQYKQKMMDHLNLDCYETLKKDPTDSLTRKLDTILKKLLKEHKLDKSFYQSCRTSNPRKPQLYGLPKIHKPGNPIRLIVSFYCTPLSSLHKQLSMILKPLTISPLRLKDSLDFVNHLKNRH